MTIKISTENIRDVAPNLRRDYKRIHDMMSRDDLIAVLFKNFKKVIQKVAKKLEKASCELVICIPVKHGSNLENLFDNLDRLDLPLKTGILLGCEKYNGRDHWIDEVNFYIDKIIHKFVFCSIVPMVPAWEAIRKKQPELQEWIELIRKIQADAGVKHPAPLNYGVMVAREELRIVAKQILCNYVLWFDADLVVPRDLIRKLIRHVDNADVIAGWTYNRHLPYRASTVFTQKPYKEQDTKDRGYYDKGKRIITKFLKGLEKAGIINSTNQDKDIQRLDNEFDSGGYSIPPWYLKTETKPIDLLWTGFECALTTKKVNDRASFLKTDNMMGGGEDHTFCLYARKLGFKIVVDPTCKLLPAR